MINDINALQKKIKALELRVTIFENQLMRALELVSRDPSEPESTIVKCRVILEKIIKDIYSRIELEIPKKAIELGGLLNNNQFTRNLPSRIVVRMNSVREFGNLGAHDKGLVTKSDAIDCLKCMVEILEWYCHEFLGDEISQTVSGPETGGGLCGQSFKKKSENSFFQRYFKVVVPVSIVLIVAVGLLIFTALPESQKNAESRLNTTATQPATTTTPFSQFDQLLAQGVGREVQAVLKVAYSTKISEPTPSAAIAAMANQTSNPAKSWHLLKDGESLSSADNYRIMFCPEKTTFFYVVQIDSRGKLDWLFPANQITPFSVGMNPVPTGLWIQTPEGDAAFHLDENEGVEHLYVIATQSRWDDLEKALAKVGRTTIQSTHIQTAFNLKTRGAGGSRLVKATSLPETNIASSEVCRLITGKEGVLVWEKWFRHIAPNPK
ncbi:MAG: hypothetical protein DRH07_11780 [Deltaproteobacteria bacterium]|nr:MAG: hypothetical protein DRH07_11780 [Deltaproteobacteria bacterium]